MNESKNVVIKLKSIPGKVIHFNGEGTRTNPKVKVAFFTDILLRDFDGAIKTMYQLIDRIPEERFEYLFFSGVLPKETLKQEVIQVPAVSTPFNINYKVVLPEYGRRRLTEALARFQPDVIHISTPSPLGFFALDYAKKYHIPVLSIYHTHFLSYMQYYFRGLPFLIPWTEAFVKKMYRKFYNQCDLVYTPTAYITEELKECGISGKLLKLWQRGLNLRLFNPGKRDELFIKSLTGNDRPCLLFASRLVWEKNVETLFRIYEEAEALQLDLNFIIAGSGAAEEEARKRMKKAVFLGFVDPETLARVYASCDLFVFTSVSETYGNVVVEAMASGCVPVIARGGGSQSLVENGENGFLCDAEDPKDYLTKILRLLNDKKLKERMQSSGYRYTSGLSWERLADAYFKDIENLAGENKTASRERGKSLVLRNDRPLSPAKLMSWISNV